MSITATATNGLLCLALSLGALHAQIGTVHAASRAVPGPFKVPLAMLPLVGR